MRRRRVVEETSSHERWLLSYSDFMTLLFALFVVLFATSYRDNQAIRKLSRAIHSGFQEMGAMSGSSGVEKNSPVNTPPAGFDSRLPVEDVPSGGGIDFTELRRQLESAIGQEIRDHEIELRVTPEGFVVSLKDLGFFNSGQAVLRPGASEKLERIARVLAQHKLELRIEGHSDDQPIHTPEFRSNWELSTARATTVLLMLLDSSGVDPHRISVAGYGQFRPIGDNSTPEGRAQNRRVDLVVVATGRTTPAPR